MTKFNQCLRIVISVVSVPPNRKSKKQTNQNALQTLPTQVVEDLPEARAAQGGEKSPGQVDAIPFSDQ